MRLHCLSMQYTFVQQLRQQREITYHPLSSFQHWHLRFVDLLLLLPPSAGPPSLSRLILHQVDASWFCFCLRRAAKAKSLSPPLWLQEPAAAAIFGGLLLDAFVFFVFVFVGHDYTYVSLHASICGYHLSAVIWYVPLLLQPSSACERDGADLHVLDYASYGWHLLLLPENRIYIFFSFPSDFHLLLHLFVPLNRGVQGTPTSPPAD